MYKNILVPIDITEPELANIVISHVESLAKLSDSSIHFLTVIPTFPYYAALGIAYAISDLDKDEIQKNAISHLEEIVKKFDIPQNKIYTHVLSGTPRDNILKTADNIQSDLIIVASRRPSLTTHLLGSTADSIVRYAKTSVLVVR